MRTAIDNATAIAGQQMPFAPQWDPLKDPQIEFAIRLHQLAIISDRLLDFYIDDIAKTEAVKGCIHLLSAGNINSAGTQLQKLVFDFNVDDQRRKKLRDIFKEGVRFGEKMLEELLGGDFPQILLQRPKVFLL